MNIVSTQSWHRRHALIGIGAVSAGVMIPSRAVAQGEAGDGCSEEQIKSVAAAILKSEAATTGLVSILEDQRLSVEAKRESALRLISEAEDALWEMLNPKTLDVDENESHCLWRHEFYTLGLLIEEKNLSTQHIYPQQELKDVKPDPEAESCVEVCIDVILEIFGIAGKELRAAITGALEQAGLYDLAFRMGRSAKRGNWSSVTYYAKQLFTKLFSEDALNTLRRAGLNDELLEKVLKKAGSRFLPWVGPALLAYDVTYAIWNNWDSIKNCEL